MRTKKGKKEKDKKNFILCFLLQASGRHPILKSLFLGEITTNYCVQTPGGSKECKKKKGRVRNMWRRCVTQEGGEDLWMTA